MTTFIQQLITLILKCKFCKSVVLFLLEREVDLGLDVEVEFGLEVFHTGSCFKERTQG